MMGERNIGVGVDFSENSDYALKWALCNLTRHGDNVFVIYVNTVGVDEGEGLLWQDTGAPLIPLEELEEAALKSKHGIRWKPQVVEELKSAAAQKGLKIYAKVYWGDPKQKLCSAVSEIPLDMVVVGSRGLGVIMRAFVGSVSDYVVNNAVCPVTVVKTAQGSRSTT